MKWYHDLDNAYGDDDDDDGSAASVFKIDRVNINDNKYIIFLCRKLIGVFSSMYSLRAQFGSDTMKNAVHGSSSVEKAEKVIKEFFPEVEILPDGTVKGLSLLFITSSACVSMGY